MSPLQEIGRFADIRMDLEMELDRKTMPVRQILEWEAGSVLWLTRSAGENIDILAGGTLFGFGEIVVIENTFGVRITNFNVET